MTTPKYLSPLACPESIRELRSAAADLCKMSFERFPILARSIGESMGKCMPKLLIIFRRHSRIAQNLSTHELNPCRLINAQRARGGNILG